LFKNRKLLKKFSGIPAGISEIPADNSTHNDSRKGIPGGLELFIRPKLREQPNGAGAWPTQVFL